MAKKPYKPIYGQTWRVVNQIKEALYYQEQVQSSTIKQITYKPYSLFVRFKSGALYKYFDVPIAVMHQFRDAPSKGQFLHRQVKEKYRYKRLE